MWKVLHKQSIWKISINNSEVEVCMWANDFDIYFRNQLENAKNAKNILPNLT